MCMRWAAPVENFSKTGDCSDASWILFLWSGSIGDDYGVQIWKTFSSSADAEPKLCA